MLSIRTRHIVSVAAALFCTLGALAQPSLDGFLDTAEYWTDGADSFMQAFAPLGFNFVSGCDIARSDNRALSFLGHPVAEAFAYFSQGEVAKISFTVYNRGDAGIELDKAEFEKLVKEVGGGIRAWAGNAGRAGVDDSTHGKQQTKSHQWSKAPTNVLLEWAFTDEIHRNGIRVPYRAEFLRVTMVPTKKPGGSSVPQSATSSKQGQVTGYKLKANVGKSSNGDICINGVPMVDQGQKGYCAAATSERLLRYYGREIDQHDVAQLADTARTGGTSSEGMLKALATIGKQFSLDVKKLYDPDWKDFQRIIRDYDKAARAKHVPPLPDYGNTILVNKLYEDMDALVLKQSRLLDKQAFGKFKKDIKTYVDSGVPLIWSCIVGKFPENPPLNIMGVGGHMRMVIGYNAKTEELLYSDSWGPGHDLKRMPMSEAWAILTGMYVLKPRDIR